MSEALKQSSKSSGEAESGWEEVGAMSKNNTSEYMQVPKMRNSDNGWGNVGAMSKNNTSEHMQVPKMRDDNTDWENLGDDADDRKPKDRSEVVKISETDADKDDIEVHDEGSGKVDEVVRSDEDDGITFIMKGVNRDEAPFRTTKVAELSKYRELIAEAQDSHGLQEATRLRGQLESALGKSKALDMEFEEINRQTGYKKKRMRFGLIDLGARIDKESSELKSFESRAKKYKGFLGWLRGAFGEGRAERKELQYQIGRVRHSLEIAKRMQKDLEEDLAETRNS